VPGFYTVRKKSEVSPSPMDANNSAKTGQAPMSLEEKRTMVVGIGRSVMKQANRPLPIWSVMHAQPLFK